MKKFLQICSLFTFVFVLSAFSANAQSTYGSEVEIPFAFSINDRSYEAGKYIVKVSKFQNGSATIVVTDPKTESIQTVLAQRNGDNTDDSVKLLFETVDGEKVLTRVATPSGGFALRLNRQKRDVAENIVARPDTVTIADLF